MDNPILQAALAYAKAGIHIVPCEPCDKKPCGSLVPRDLGPDRNPINGTGGLKKATNDPVKIEEWWKLIPNAMVGVATGVTSGFWVVDIDTPKQANGAPRRKIQNSRPRRRDGAENGLPNSQAARRKRPGNRRSHPRENRKARGRL